MIDTHLHSFFSPDSKESPENIVLTAIERKLDTIIITDHYDDYPYPSPNIFLFNPDEYFETWTGLKEKYKHQIEILIGVEVGLQPDMCDANDAFVQSYPFDFVIGSIHAVDGKDIYMDRYLEKHEPTEALYKYYEDMLYCVKNTKQFHVLGHIDYIDRYFEDKSTIPDYSLFLPIIEDCLKELIHSNRGIECNTAGLRKGLSYMNPKDEVLQLYHDLGGEIITIGSDAHVAKDIAADFEHGKNILQQIGFSKLSKFIKMERVSIPL